MLNKIAVLSDFGQILTGVFGDLEGEDDDLAGVFGELAGADHDLAGAGGDPAAEGGDLAGANGDLAAVRDDLAGACGPPTGRVRPLAFLEALDSGADRTPIKPVENKYCEFSAPTAIVFSVVGSPCPTRFDPIGPIQAAGMFQPIFELKRLTCPV